MTKDMGASPDGDRAVAASPSSPSVSPVPASIPSAKRDDKVREHHGCACSKGDVKLAEVSEGIKIQADYNAILEPRHARYLARKLYHLARKIERRSAVRDSECAPEKSA